MPAASQVDFSGVAILALVASLLGAPGLRAETCPLAPAALEGAAAGVAEGNAALARGEAEAARRAFERSEREARAQGAMRLAWIAAANAVRAQVAAGDLEGVEARLEALEAGEVPAAFRPALLVNLARTWRELGERAPERAARSAVRADALLREAAEASDEPRLRSTALGARGALYESAGRLVEARTLTRRALFEAAQVGAPALEARWHWQLGRIERRAGEVPRALTALREAVRLLDTLRAELAAEAAQDASGFRESVEPAYLDLVDLLLERAATAEGAPRQEALREARDALESLKAAELRDYYGDPCLAAQTEVVAETLPGVVVLYPVVLPDRVELIVGRAEGLELFRSPVDAATLTETVRRFRRLLPKRTTRQYLGPARQLYDWLIRPAAPVLDGARISALVVVPGGALRTIPFAALRDERQGLFLAEKVAVATAPGLTLTDPRPIDPERVQLLAAGVSEAVQGYPPLPAVREELAGLEARFGGEALVDAGFDAARLEAAVRERPYGIVHIASHGEFRSEAGESFVLAYDRKISMQELADVVGRTRLRTEQPLELLALSACQTAAGDDRAALGLAGVALRAGARSALGTLWSVSDEASARLVARFYAELDGGASRAEALRSAQRELLATRAWRHPGYWSPFLMISSWL